MTPATNRFAVYDCHGGDYQIVDTLVEKEICLVSEYQDEPAPAKERADYLALLLNCHGEGLIDILEVTHDKCSSHQ